MNYKTILFLVAILFLGGNCKFITVPGASSYNETYTTGRDSSYTVKLSCDNFTTLEVWRNPSDDGTPVIQKHSIISTFKARRSIVFSNPVTIDIEISSDLGVETTCVLGITEDKIDAVIIISWIVFGIIVGIIFFILSIYMIILLILIRREKK